MYIKRQTKKLDTDRQIDKRYLKSKNFIFYYFEYNSWIDSHEIDGLIDRLIDRFYSEMDRQIKRCRDIVNPKCCLQIHIEYN